MLLAPIVIFMFLDVFPFTVEYDNPTIGTVFDLDVIDKLFLKNKVPLSSTIFAESVPEKE